MDKTFGHGGVRMASTMTKIYFTPLLLLLLASSLTVEASDIRKPSITKYSSKPSASVGQLVTLYCQFTGSPLLKASWTRPDSKGAQTIDKCRGCIYDLDNSKTGRSILRVTPFKDEDFGLYECRVRNKYGVALRKISLRKINLTDTSPCQYERILARDPRLRIGYLPKCDPDGKYHRVQCSIHTTDCWCVNRETGHKNADAYGDGDTYHCTPPIDITAGVITSAIFAFIVILFMADMLYFAYYKKGVLAFCFKQFLQRRMAILERKDPQAKVEEQVELSPQPQNDKPSTGVKVKEKKRRRKKKKKNEEYHIVSLEEPD